MATRRMSPERVAQQMARRELRYNELRRYTKAELLAMVGRSYRIHSMCIHDSKADLIRAVLEAELPIR